MQKITDFTLSNGLRLIFARDHSVPIISLNLFVRMGSCWELPRESGFSHFLEHLVFKSTRRFPENSISDRAAYLGGNLNAYTEHDSTCFLLTLPSRYTRDGLEILSELVRESTFSRDDFEFEKKVVLEELKQYRNEPEEFFVEEIPRRYFETSPFRNPIIGEEANLLDSRHDDLIRFYQTWYRPENCFLVAAGDLDETEMKDLCESFFGTWEPGMGHKPEYQPEPYPSENRIESIIYEQTRFDTLAFVIPEFSENHPDNHALNLLTKAFAWGRSSRLYRRLYEDERLVDNIKMHSFCGICDGISVILMHPRSRDLIPRVCEVFVDEMRKIHNFGLGQTEIEREKREMLFGYRYSMEYMESLALGIGAEELTAEFRNYLDYPLNINRITREQIDRIASEYYQPNRLHIYHLGPEPYPVDSLYSAISTLPRKSRPASGTGEVFETCLDNGLKVVLKRVPEKPTVGIAVTTGVSQLHEQNGQRGINLLTATMLLHGNKKRDYDQLLEYCANRGIVLASSASIETTSLKCKCFDDSVPTSLELLSDVLFEPTFPQDHLQKVTQTFAAGLDRLKDHPQSWAFRLWREMIFGKDSNLAGRLGTKSDLRTISRKKLIDWHRRHFHPSNLVLSMVGNLDFDYVLHLIERGFGHEPRPPLPEATLESLRMRMPVRRHRRKNVGMDQSVIHIGGLGCSVEDTEENTASHVMAHILGGDLNARLFTELREKRGLAYSTGFDYYSLKKLGYYNAYAIVDRSREREALSAIRRVLREMAAKPVPEIELETARNAIRGARLAERESVLQQAHILSMLQVLGFDYQYYLDREKRLDAVCADMIRNLAERYFRPENQYSLILS